MAGQRARSSDRDTPQESPAGTGGRAAARRARARARRKPASRKKIIAWTAAAAVVLTASATGAVYLKLTGNIKSFDRAGIAPDRPPEATPTPTATSRSTCC